MAKDLEHILPESLFNATKNCVKTSIKLYTAMNEFYWVEFPDFIVK